LLGTPMRRFSMPEDSGVGIKLEFSPSGGFACIH
jgi:hypothetical protein